MTLPPDDLTWMRHAIGLSWSCPPSPGAFSVGAVLVDTHGDVLATGFSREGDDPTVHAEEAALAKLGGTVPPGTTLYSTLEPCTRRASRPVPCAQLVAAAGVARVVVAWREPALFVADCHGVEQLRQAGCEVVELPALAAEARAANTHLRW